LRPKGRNCGHVAKISASRPVWSHAFNISEFILYVFQRPRHTYRNAKPYITVTVSLSRNTSMNVLLKCACETDCCRVSTQTEAAHHWKEFLSINCISADVRWETHIEYIISNAVSQLYFLNQLKRAGLSSPHLMHFYTTMIRPVCCAFSALTLLVGRQEGHPARKNLSDEVLAWLSVWSEVQMICIWSGRCHCHPIISASENPEWFILLVPAYPGSPGKKAVKRLVCVCVCDQTSTQICLTALAPNLF